MSINVTVVGSTGVSTSIASSDQIVVAVGGTLANTPLTALQVTAGANITITTTSGVYTFIGPNVPVQSVNGQTGTVVLNLANLTAAAASHTHLMSDITDLAYPVNVVNGQTGTVLLTSTDVSAASAVHTHVASEITNLTAVANVISVNGQTGVAVLNSTNVSAASAVHTHVMADVTDLAFPVSSVNGYTGTVSLTITDLTAASASHTHAASEVTDLTSVANVVSVNGYTGVVALTIDDITAASATHTHSMAEVADITFPVNSVNGQTGTVSLTSVEVSAASAVHTHIASEVTDLTSVANVVSVNGYTGVVALTIDDITAASATHTHSMAEVADITFPVNSVNGQTGTVSLTSVEVSAASAVHTHIASEVTDLTSVANVVSINGITGTPSIVAGSGITVSTSGSSITVASGSGLPSEGGNATRLLTTDGTAASWATRYSVVDDVLAAGAGISFAKDTSAGSITIEAAGGTSGVTVGSATPQPLGTAAAGVAGNAAREDHVHAMPSAADVGAASAVHTHVASDITDFTSVANVISVNGQTGVVTVTGGVTAASVTTEALTVDENDYDAGSSDIVRLTPSANVTLTGLAGGSDGVVRVLYNVGTHVVTLATGNTNSVETNRFSIVSGNAVLSEGDSSSVWYDGTSQRWRVLEDQVTGGSGGSGGGIAMSYLFG